MIKIISNVEIEAIKRDLSQLAWTLDGTGILMAFGSNTPISVIRPFELPALWSAIKEIGWMRDLESTYIMVNNEPPGVKPMLHRDWLKIREGQDKKLAWYERWHLPIETNPNAIYWDEVGGNYHMNEGFWHGPVPYWKNHSVQNDGCTRRVHVVVDLESPVPVGEYT